MDDYTVLTVNADGQIEIIRSQDSYLLTLIGKEVDNVNVASLRMTTDEVRQLISGLEVELTKKT